MSSITISNKEIDCITVSRGKRCAATHTQSDHSHAYYELFTLSSGSCRFLLKDSLYYLHKGDVALIPPHELHHSIYPEDNPCEINILFFNRSHLPSPEIFKLNAFVGSVPLLYQPDYFGLINRMLSEQTHIDEYSDSYMRCYLHTLLLLLARHSALNEDSAMLPHSSDINIALATKYIYANFQKQLTLEDVSAVASLSPTYFSKKFKQTTGMGFKEYLNFVRLKHAQAALLTTDSTITDIALEYGFNDSNYFKDLFKKEYGKSPREYRKNPV